MGEYFSVNELAARWNISRATLWRMITHGELQAIRIGRRIVRVPASEVRRIEQNGRV